MPTIPAATLVPLPPAGRLHGHAVNELRLSQWAHLLRPGLPVACAALHKHGFGDAMPPADVGQQLTQEIVVAAGPFPQVMVRVTDW